MQSAINAPAQCVELMARTSLTLFLETKSLLSASFNGHLHLLVDPGRLLFYVQVVHNRSIKIIIRSTTSTSTCSAYLHSTSTKIENHNHEQKQLLHLLYNAVDRPFLSRLYLVFRGRSMCSYFYLFVSLCRIPGSIFTLLHFEKYHIKHDAHCLP